MFLSLHHCHCLTQDSLLHTPLPLVLPVFASLCFNLPLSCSRLPSLFSLLFLTFCDPHVSHICRPISRTGCRFSTSDAGIVLIVSDNKDSEAEKVHHDTRTGETENISPTTTSLCFPSCVSVGYPHKNSHRHENNEFSPGVAVILIHSSASHAAIRVNESSHVMSSSRSLLWVSDQHQYSMCGFLIKQNPITCIPSVLIDIND